MGIWRNIGIGLAVVGLVALGGGCTSPAPQLATTSTPSAQPSVSPYSPAPGDCPVTLPRPVPADKSWAPGLFGWGSAYGNDQLWVGGLGEGGVFAVAPDWVDADGSIGWKLGWWRISPGVLHISGRRLDASAPPLRASVPDGYGDRGFQASGVQFSTQGCWEVTGQVGPASLTFVTLVIVRTG